LKIIETVWNEKMVAAGYVYAQQKMIAQFNCTGDWAFYLEGDEIVHESDVPRIRAAMEAHLHNTAVEALVFDYHHFYGCPDLVARSPAWYRHAPRIIRNSVRSWAPDGLFWVIMDRNRRGRYPRGAMVGCPIYHYGHVRSISKAREKDRQVSRYWGHKPKFENYSQIDPGILQPFTGTHPTVIHDWLRDHAEKDFLVDPGYQLSRREYRHRALVRIERLLGRDLTKKHYKLV